MREEITDEKIIKMLKLWNKLNCNEQMVYVNCDSTNFNTTAQNIAISEFGKAKDDPGKPQVNLAVAMKQKDSIPLYYDLYPGSIIDLVQCEQLIEKMHIFGYKNARISI